MKYLDTAIKISVARSLVNNKKIRTTSLKGLIQQKANIRFIGLFIT